MLGIADMSQPSDTSKDAALRAVGRTIVNFQRLEHNLKLAALLGPVQGTLQKIQKDIAKRQERAETLTLGQAIQAWLTYLDGTQAQVVWTPDLFNISVRMTFSLEADADSQNAHAEALDSLLKTRNDLVHTRLVNFQWESPEACDTLVLELDAVNTRISEQLEYVTSLFKEILTAQREHAEAVVVAISGTSASSTAGESDA
jgi:hypothetical protein